MNENAGDGCPICRERKVGRHRQLYIIQGALGDFVFDVDRARMIVSDGRPAHAVPTTVLKRFLEVNSDWLPGHLAHVDLSIPGIIAQRFGGLTLIDGTHRAARSLGEEREFVAYLLSYNESEDCLVGRDPARVSPARIAEEIRGVLKNNQATAEHVEVSIQIDADDGCDTATAERQIREFLTPEENDSIVLIITDKGSQ